jgi:replication factor C subunit 1
VQRAGAADDRVRTQMLLKAADCVAEADVFNEYVRARQQWQLLPAMAVANCRAAAYACCPAPPIILFPAYFGRYSSRKKRERLMAEMGAHLAGRVSGGREAIRLDYFDALRTRLMAPLVARDAPEHSAEAAAQAVAMLDEYGLSSADLMETMIEVSFAKDESGYFADFAKKIDPRVKVSGCGRASMSARAQARARTCARASARARKHARARSSRARSLAGARPSL